MSSSSTKKVNFEIPDSEIGKTKSGKRVSIRRFDPSSNLIDRNNDLNIYNQPVYEYGGRIYPDYIRRGDAVKHIIPFAQHYCSGIGLDIGGTPEWHYPGAEIVNPEFTDYHATRLPGSGYDYVFSSHCLEHIKDYFSALRLWRDSLRPGGQIFLYLPHPDMTYWRPENCSKHFHSFQPQQIARDLQKLGFVQIFYSNRDLYWSFAVTGVKPWG